RRILGIAGPPGAGKSRLAAALVEALGPRAALVPLDGFHLAGAELVRLSRQDRKGAPDTFDAAGYVALLRRLRDRTEDVVYAPEFRREIEEPVAGAVPVPREVSLVITEGNYLLVSDGHWAEVRGLLDEAWYLDTPEVARLQRLIDRHIAYGRSPAEARAWARGSDQRNAELVSPTRERADLVVRLVGL
ncbi:MAG: nucleoside/nucleotide kinase family protein, partial [Candidatus Dormibacteraeota bacterium]|nr:nucleoside/nucleotide kinase family protein [Candidatus Dormibacteraeota bacterium]